MKLNRCKNTLDLYIVMDRNFRLVNNAGIVGCALILVLTRVDSHVNYLITNTDRRDLRMRYFVLIVLTVVGFSRYSSS